MEKVDPMDKYLDPPDDDGGEITPEQQIERLETTIRIAHDDIRNYHLALKARDEEIAMLKADLAGIGWRYWIDSEAVC